MRDSADGGAPSNVLYDNLSALRHAQGNHEAELRQIDNKFQNVELIIESMRKQLHEINKGNKDLVTTSTANFSAKVGDVELTMRSLIADLQQFKTHANETSTALGQFQQRITDLEKLSEQQRKYIEHLQNAIKALTELLQGKDVDSQSAGQVYSVKVGDSLGEIAQKHGTTIKEIKLLNNLTTDRINVNQKLKIPEK
jgi:LysM repeat protein